MRLKENRIQISKSEVLSTIYGISDKSSDLSFANDENLLDLSLFELELNLIKQRNFPLVRQILQALEKKEILLGRNTNNTGSVLFAYGMENKTLTKVFINMSKFINVGTGKIDLKTGLPLAKIQFVGGYEMFYDILFAAYCGLKAEKCYSSPSITKIVRNFYVDMMAQITSRNFGNPGNGVKFRFITDVLFYNGDMNGIDIADMTMFNKNEASILQTKYPDFFEKNKEGNSINRWIEIVNEEFPVFKEPVKLSKFIVGSVNGLGENGIYAIDNHAYIISIMILKARRSKAIAGGYILKSLEVSPQAFLSDVQKTLI